MSKDRVGDEGARVPWDEVEDFPSFAGALAALGEVTVTVMEVPLRWFVEASEHDALAGLEIQVDEHGNPFLMALMSVGSHRAVMVSESFAAVPEAGGDDA